MRQRISLLAACGLATVGLAALPATAANAAEPVFRLTGPPGLVLPPAPATGSPTPAALNYRLEAPAGAAAFDGDITLTVDLAKLNGVATVQESPGAAAKKCAPVGSTLVCTQHGLRPGVPAGVDLEVVPGKKTGVGVVVVTGTAAGATITPANPTGIKIGAPDLVMGQLDLKKDLKPGESQPLPLTFSNTGNEPARGVVLELEASHGLELPERYDNCTYRTTRTATDVVCTIEGDFDAKASYELAGDSPLHLKAGPNALNERLGYGIYPAPVPQKPQAEAGTTGTQQNGTGKPAAGDAAGKASRKLVARKAPQAALAEHGPDLNPADNKREAALTVQNTADFEAEPLVVKGAAGTTAKAVVAIRNNGPAWIADQGGAPAAVVDVELPKGLKAVTVPTACRPVSESLYRCATAPSVLERENVEFPFEFKIEKAVKDAKGAVRVGAPGPKGEPQRHSFDPVLANNLAALTANPTSTGATPSPSGSPSPSTSASSSASPSPSASGGTTANGGTSGSGPLASTGSQAGLLGLGAAGLLAVGGALFLSARRRKAGHA
ncbi:LPXTG cell wall anchor domain-containing protein [Streptomyces sp. NPDC001594]|uniref:LPXTG cell wall anchor domain-containing protein n=1 Tax=Streptomyces sp. NPDC001594 TaxID=3364590 RepID=UPI0036C5A41F